MHLALIVALVATAQANKPQQAVYSSNYTTAYLLSGNDLYTLVLNGETESSDTLSEELKQIKAPVSPDSQLAIDSRDNLYALSGSGCGTFIDLQVYNSTADTWSSLDSSPSGWYNLNSTCWYDTASDSLLIYGGLDCDSTITQDFYKYSLKDQKWSQASANPMPREMAFASTIALSPDSTMVVGGRTNDGWLSMQQVAVWQYGGWSYVPVSNYTGIDSRDDAFLLPMWNNTQSSVDSILVIGGTVAGRDASPSVLVLGFDQDKGWHWNSASIPQADVMLTVYNAVYTNNAIYNPSIGGTQKSVAPTKLEQKTAEAEKKGLDVGSIAALSTIIPLFFIIIGCVGVWIWWRKRKQRAVFQPRQSQITDNQSIDISDNFPDFYYPPVRQKERRVLPHIAHHQKDASHTEYKPNDVQFLLNRESTNLRVVNPDVDQSSVSSYGTLTSDSGPLLKDEQQSISSAGSENTIGSSCRSHRTTGSCDISEMVRVGVSSRSSSGSRRQAKREYSSTSFDFGDAK